MAVWAFAIVLAAIAAILFFDGKVDREADTSTAFVSLRGDINEQSALEWEAIARERISDEISERTKTLRTSIREMVESVSGEGESAQINRLPSAVDTYYDAINAEFARLSVGDVSGAEELDETRVDPAFDRLANLLTVASEQKASAAARFNGVALAGTIATLLLAAALISILFWRFQRTRSRQAVELSQRQTLETSERRFRALIEEATDTITVIAPDGSIRMQTGAIQSLLGIEAAEVLGTPFTELLHPDDRSLFDTVPTERVDGDRKVVSWRMGHADGHFVEVETAITDLREDDRVDGTVLTTRDVTDQKALEEQLRHRAFHDPLTQLANRALFLDRVEHAIAREGRRSELVAVMFIDLDDFKVFNDRYGHAGGDELLIGAAARLRSSLRSADTAARLGGDEFGVLLEAVSGHGEAAEAAGRVLAAFEEPIVVHGRPVKLSPSVGVAVSTLGSTDPDLLLRQADVAMYAAKQNGKGRYELHQSGDGENPGEALAGTDAADKDRWFLRGEESREEILSILSDPAGIRAVFQPIVELGTGRTAGYEALARFKSASDRPPNAWFAQAHRSGIGPELEAKALEAAFAAPGREPGTYLSVNVSPSAIGSRAIEAVLPSDLSDLVIEITENELIGEGTELRMAMDELKRRGARIAVDDAGSGYASFRQLTQLQPDIIKLDRTLIDGAHSDPARLALVESLVLFAARIDAEVCGEGIETLEDLRALADLDVTYGQGYVLARPDAPWPLVDPAATDALTVSSSEFMARGSVSQVSYPVHSQLERVAARLSLASDAKALNAAMTAVAGSLNADEVHLSVLDGDETLLTVAAHSDGNPVGRSFSLRDFPVTKRVLHSQGVEEVLAGSGQAQEEIRWLQEQGPYESLLLVPIVFGGRTVGLLEACARTSRGWGRLQIIRARMIGFQIGTVLQNLPDIAAESAAARDDELVLAEGRTPKMAPA